MIQVKSFLGCCQLETGGIVLGWFFFCTFLLATTIVFVYGSMLIVAGPHPLYTLIWLDVIIFWIIVIYASWLMIQGIKTKNPSKIQPFRFIFIAAIFLCIIDLIYFVCKIYFKKPRPENEREIFDIIEQDFKAVRIFVNLLMLGSSIYIFIFVDSLHKSVKEFRNRYYVVAKL